MKKRWIWLAVTAAVLLSVAVGTTLALLIASSNRVDNTFTVGNVEIALSETTGDTYKLIPGVTLDKDPRVTVKAKSEDCWLFVKVERSVGFDRYCRYELADGWIALAGHSDVYYRRVAKAGVDLVFHVLHNDRVMVYDTVTEEQLAAIGRVPTLTVTAYAVQSRGVDTAADAWQIVCP